MSADAGATRPAPPPRARGWIAVVDDDASVRRALARVLRAEGWPVGTFATADEYLAAVAPEDDPACLVLDLYLGAASRMSGVALHACLAAAGSAVRIVFITADEDAVAMARQAGARDCLLKPIRVADLLARVGPPTPAGGPPHGTAGDSHSRRTMPTNSHLHQDPELAGRLAAAFGRASDPMPDVEARAHALLPDYDFIVWEGDATTFHFGYVGRASERLLGYPAERWTSEPPFWSGTVVHPDDRDDAIAYCALCTGKGEDHDFEYRAVAADGRVVVLHDVVKVIKGERGVATRLRGIMLDVTARRVAAGAGATQRAMLR